MTIRVLAAGELDLAAELLASGEVLAVPTDTVYGLAALVGDRAAIEQLSALKRRPGSMPIAVLCASVEEARELASSWPPSAAALSTALWPGPLTLVVPASVELESQLGSTSGAGMRIPNDATCRALLERTGPLAVTSANVHGSSPATSAEEVLGIFEGSGLAGVLDAGTRDGAVSSVVDVSGERPVIVREGALSRDALCGVLREG
jgi:tRNA threonylcarbamoyl adenosine modification protein (Sua5/YciO/YrdC/YwlC family)